MNRIDQPIIIVGTGRCGSTMLHRLVARHPDVGWLSTYNEVFPTRPRLSRFSNLYRHPRLSERTKHLKFFPKPFEAYRFWEHFLPGFSRRDEPLTAADVPNEALAPLHTELARVLAFQGKNRLLVKVTGWSRIAYFDRIFPDARFVFLNRELRSVLSSWVKAGWLDVTSALDSPRWQWGEVPTGYRERWQDLGGGPLLSAALKIQLDLDDIRRNSALLPDRVFEMQYEDLVARPHQTMRALTDFCQLEWGEEFENIVDGMTFYDASGKWKRHLSEEEGHLVLEFASRLRECAT